MINLPLKLSHIDYGLRSPGGLGIPLRRRCEGLGGMMKNVFLCIAFALRCMAASGGDLDSIRISRAGEQPSAIASARFFTGPARIDQAFEGQSPSRLGGAIVTFEPGARTAWHIHPLGQFLIVLAGAGWVQEWGKPIREIRPGDVVWIPPGVKHWHGASSTTGVSHLAIAEKLDGSAVQWLEQVGEKQYLGSPVVR